MGKNVFPLFRRKIIFQSFPHFLPVTFHCPELCHVSIPRPAFLKLSLVDISGQIILYCRGCPGHGRTLSSISDLYALDARDIFPVMTTQKCLQKLPMSCACVWVRACVSVCVCMCMIACIENHCPRPMTGQEKWDSQNWLRPVMGQPWGSELCGLERVLFKGNVVVVGLAIIPHVAFLLFKEMLLLEV